MVVSRTMYGSRPLVAEPPVEPDALSPTSNLILVCVDVEASVQSVECAPVNLFRYASMHSDRLDMPLMV